MEIRIQDIDDCLDRLEKIAFLFSVEWGNKPSAIVIYDSGLLQILTKLHVLLSVKYEGVDVMQNIETFLEFEELSTRFRKIEEVLSSAITETYREVQIQSLGDAYDKLVDIAIDYPLDKPVVTPQELHERVQKIKFLAEDTYRILHFYVTYALIEIRDMLYLNANEQRRIEMIRQGFRDYLNERKTEFGVELCYSPLCERIAGFFRASITEKIEPVHWEQLYRIDKLTIDFAIKKETNRKDFMPEFIKAARELLASTKKLDTEIEDICKRHIQSRFVKGLFENKMLAHLLSPKLNKEKRLIDIDRFNLNTIGQLLNSENIYWFYETIHRHNVIQCGMFPELKPKYELWLMGPEKIDNDIAPLSHNRQTIYDSIMKYINKGDWKAPATMENVKDFMHVVLGLEPSRLDAADRQKPEELWKLLTSGRTTCKKDGNTRLEITWAKICGLFYSYDFFYGEPQHILKKIFGELKNLNSPFSKGKKPDDKGYREILPFLEKYIEKIIKT